MSDSEISEVEDGVVTTSPARRSRSGSPRRRSPVRNRSADKLFFEDRRGTRRGSRVDRRPRLPLRRRSRSRSPPRRPPSNHLKGMVVIVRSSQERTWRYEFQHAGFKVYDHVYPFRMAMRTVFRQDPRQPRIGNSFAGVDVEPYARHLVQLTTEWMGPSFVYDYFMDWYRRQDRSNQDRVVICGLGADPGSEFAVNQLRSKGAVVVSQPPLPGDVFIRRTEELTMWLRDMR